MNLLTLSSSSEIGVRRAFLSNSMEDMIPAAAAKTCLEEEARMTSSFSFFRKSQKASSNSWILLLSSFPLSSPFSLPSRASFADMG